MGKLWWYEESMWPGERIRCAELAQAEVSEGGWYDGKSWLTDKAIKEAEHRWAMRSYDKRAEKQGIVSPEYGGTKDWSGWQCGCCKFMAALGSDYGICWNKNSPLDGCIIFEHGGCVEHSGLVKLLEAVMGE